MQFNLPNFNSNRQIGSSQTYTRPLNLKKFPMWVFIIIGVIGIAAGFFFVADENKTSSWPTIAATVVDIDSKTRRDNSGNQQTTHSYTVAYTVDGKEYQDRGMTDSYIAMGDTVTLIYNPENPAQNRLDGTTRGWTGWLIIAGGIFFTVVASLLTFNKRLRHFAGSQPETPAQQ